MQRKIQTAVLILSLLVSEGLSANDTILHNSNRVNVMVVNKVRDFDMYSKTLFARAKIKSILSKGRFIVIEANSSADMLQKITVAMNKKNAMIGTLWFDSHGYFKNGYSSFSIGHEEFSYKTIRDSLKTNYLAQLSAFCDVNTQVIIGSCYGGATYKRTLPGDTASTMMYGDSLMIGLSDHLNGSTVFGSESWVMMKPGIFKNSYAFAGHPWGKKYRDQILEPVWKNIGKWNRYCGRQKKMEKVHTISLNKYADLTINQKSYQHKKRIQKSIQRKLKKLENAETFIARSDTNHNSDYLR